MHLNAADSRALAERSRVLLARLHSEIAATRTRLVVSQQKLESTLAMLQDVPHSQLGTLSSRIQALATSIQELSLRLVVELSATSDELQIQVAVADEVRSLADFCALVVEAPLGHSERERAGQVS